MSAEKKRWPRRDALDVARELCTVMLPFCERLIVAGSLRRGRADVGDVELLFVPRFELRAVDMFSTAQVSLADEAIDGMLATGLLSKRPNRNGGFAWGEKNKLALHRSGMPVDLFTASAENWWNYLVCRTGPAESNARIATAALAKGWQWHPYGSGCSRGGLLAGSTETHVVTCERDVFDFVGLPFLEPEERK